MRSSSHTLYNLYCRNRYLDLTRFARTRARFGTLVLVWSTAAACTLTSEALAQGSGPARLYVGLGVGPVIPASVTANLDGAIIGSGTLKFNAAGFLGLLIGYRLTDHFGLEAEGGWALYDSYSLAGRFSGSGGLLPRSIPLNGDMHTWLGLVNAVYRFRSEGARVAPYLGAGIGAARLKWLVESRPGGTIPLRLEGASTGPAADAMAGIEYAVSRRFSVGGRYSFVRILDDGPIVRGRGIDLSHGEPSLHLIQLIGTLCL